MSRFCTTTGLIFLLLFALSGCSQSARGLFDDYLGRLSNVLDTPKLEPDIPAPQGAPRSRELQLTIPDLRVTPLAYWNLRHCELFRLISERNSILGRVAPAHTQWRYEAEVLAAIARCRDHPDTREDQQDQLDAWAEQKRDNWPRATWNGTIASPEVRQLWSADADGWHPDRVPSLSTLHNDLQTLTSWARNWPTDDMPDDSTFSDVYQRLGQHSSGGQWRRSVQISNSGLRAANHMLEAAINAGRLCPAGQPTRAAEHAQNVLTLFFIGEVQPYLAQLNRNGERLLTDFAALTSATGVEPQHWELFMAQLAAELAELQTLNRRHADHWQTLLDQCDLQVGV